MNDRQYEALRMYQQVKATIEKHTAVWNDNVRLSADFSLFLLHLSSIETHAVSQEVNHAGIGQMKQKLRAELVEQILLTATAVETFAHDTHNSTLAASVHYQESRLKKTREMALIAAGQVILDQAGIHVGSLSDYGVTPASLSELQTALTQFKNMNPQPKTAISQSKTVTQNLKELFRDTTELLTKGIDGKLLQYKKKAPAFYAEYTQARRVSRQTIKTKKSVPEGNLVPEEKVHASCI